MSSFIKKNWFISLLVVIFAAVSIYYIYDTNKGKLKGKTSNGEDVVYTVGDKDVTASAFYDAMFENAGTSVLYQSFVKAVSEQSIETTDEMRQNAASQASSVISNYQSSYPSNYRDMLDSQLKALGYKGYEDLETYLIDYSKQNQITAEYAEAHFDELKIRNISYLLIKFENGDSGEGTPTADEKARMDAVDAAFAEGKTFEEVAKEFSEDSSTSENGGVLGTVDANTTTLDTDFLNGALALEEGEISDWIYSSNFGYFRVQNNASTPEKLLALYREQNAIPEDTEITAAEVYASLLGDYDTTLANKALYEKAQTLGVTFANSDDEAKLKEYLGIEE